ncbi:hypothetical protein BCD67_03220 [Oscillatoriales cyanobacterium USR001]|nr:hypothetical protein BCD67_03220 [Oscillatoriales cyanobacterium USR001]
MNRRKFTRIALLGGASFATTSGIFFPKPAQAFFLDFTLGNLSTGKVFRELINSVQATVLGDIGNVNLSPPKNVAINNTEKDFIQRKFIKDRSPLAQSGAGGTASLLWGRGKQDQLGRPNVGFGFVQEYQNAFPTAKISGPTMTGIYQASQILRDQRLIPQEIADSLMPTRSRYDDWGTWDGEKDRPEAFTAYETPGGTLEARYQLLEPGINGKGKISITIEAENQPRRDITVIVSFR